MVTPPPLSRFEREPGRSRTARACWLAFFLSPGLCVAGGATFMYVFNADPTPPEFYAMLLCWIVLALNAVVVALPTPRGWMLRERWGLVVSAGALAVALVAAEFVLHLLLVPPPFHAEGSIYRVDPGLGFDHKPASSCRDSLGRAFDVTYTIDSRGTRGPDRIASHPLVLALGCSQTFGHGVADDQTWPRRLEARLEGAAFVANGGVSAYGPQQMMLRGRRLSEFLKPDLILVGLAEWQLVRLGQDPGWNGSIGDFGLRLPVLAERNGKVVVERFVPEQVVPRDEVTVLRWSEGGGDGRFRLLLYKEAKRALLAAGRLAEEAVTARPSHDLGPRRDGHATWRLLALAIRSFADLAAESRAPVILLLLPEPLRAGNPDYEDFRAAVWRLAGRHHLEVWDLGAEVATATGGRSLALNRFYEPHYNAAAHDAIAQVLAPKVAGRLRDSGAASAADQAKVF